MSAELLDEAWEKKLYHSGDAGYSTNNTSRVPESTLFSGINEQASVAEINDAFEPVILGLADLVIRAAEVMLEDEATSGQFDAQYVSDEAAAFMSDGSYLSFNEASLLADGSALDMSSGDMAGFEGGDSMGDSGGAGGDSGAGGGDGGAGGGGGDS